MNINQIPAFKGSTVNGIIETPRGAAMKLNYDAELDLFRLKKFLPLGMVFPFDFGFIPNTLGEDGDPLDVVVFADAPLYPGCLVACRLLGVLKVRQTDRGKQAVRNDRYIAVPKASLMYGNVWKVADLGIDVESRVENFFIDYNKRQGKIFESLGWGDSAEAFQMIGDAVVIS